MKAEVVLRRINRGSEGKEEDLGLSDRLSTEEEQYSPTDFINQLNGKGSLGSHSSISPNSATTAAPSPTSPGGNVSVAQSVIRPIPIIPMDSSIYSTPPTYIDTLPIVTLPMVPSQLLGNQVQRSESVIHQQQGTSCPENVEPLRCQWMNCEEAFTLMEDLVNHVNDYHVRVERPDVEYQCKWDGCPRKGKGFNARYKMLIHIRTHTNEKPHKCSLCGKSFSRLENLKIHNRSHTGEKPYTCPFEGCNKAYSNSSDRFKHVRTHQEDKPYICKMPGCNKRYTDPSSLRKHVRTHGHHCKTGSQGKTTHPNAPGSPQSDQGNVLSPSAGMTKLCPLSPTSLLVPVSHASSLCFNSSFSAVGFENGGLGSVLHVPSLSSNPLLSSTIISVQPQNFSTQHYKDSVTVKVPHRDHIKTPAGIEGATDVKSQNADCPLDLSTGPTSPTIIISTQDVEMSSASHVSGQEAIGSEVSQWEVIQTES